MSSRAQLDHAVAEANGALDELREIARGIHPAILAERRAAARRSARSPAAPRSRSSSTCASSGRLPEQIEIAPTTSSPRR